MSTLPIHQDGSCNGLQHYAALGRDELGGKAVNLFPSSSPQDVYSKVLEIVLREIEKDALIPANAADESLRRKGRLYFRVSELHSVYRSGVSARLVRGHVNRKVIKQTVMTSVYGVTSRGAKDQVQARLLERLANESNSVVTPEVEAEISQAARYVAVCTLKALAEMFSSAKAIMDWLGTCATLVASEGQTMSWVTPLGLPVIQPYRQSTKKIVRTLLQMVILAVDSDDLPVSSRKQRSAFPPNFVHSLGITNTLLF